MNRFASLYALGIIKSTLDELADSLGLGRNRAPLDPPVVNAGNEVIGQAKDEWALIHGARNYRIQKRWTSPIERSIW